MTVPNGLVAMKMAERLMMTINREPIWGKPAGHFLCTGVDFMNDTRELEIVVTEQFTRLIGGACPYPAIEWTEIEASSELLS